VARDWRDPSTAETFFFLHYFFTYPGAKNAVDSEFGKNKYFRVNERLNLKMNSRFSVFFSFHAVKIKSRCENLIVRCKHIEWESLQV